ncbi:MAG: hypothetical protein M0007_12805, partial [Actinomycetota bacterium]|nr:hypothetical protein [Actinomycetota bacterium]
MPADDPRTVPADDPRAEAEEPPLHDVVAVGNALVDVLARTDDVAPDRLGLAKGTMELVDAVRSQT